MARAVLSPEAARKLTALLRGSGAVTRRDGMLRSVALPTEYPDPFAVQWAQSLAEGEGSWIIWLPTTDLVVVPESAINPAEELDDAEGDYPTGWYVLTDAMLSRQNGGTLYLNVTLGDTPTATFASSASSDADTFGISICTANVDATSGERKVRQFVTSAIVVGGEGGGGGAYGCDESSISRIAHSSESGEADENGNNFYIKGFGKWTIGGSAEVGSYHPPSTDDVDVDGEETEFAVICRDGNVSTANGNTLAYRKLRIKSNSGSSPFAYKKSTGTDPDTHQPVTLHKLVNCEFYWDGVLQSLADYDVSGLLGGGTVYLVGTQAAPSANDHQPSWAWSLQTSEQQAPSGGKVLNYKLYDFAQSKVAVDYRTTFLALEDHTPKDVLIVGDPNGAHLELSSTRWLGAGASPYIALFTSGGVSLGGFSAHEIRYKDSTGSTTLVKHGLFDDNIDLTHLTPGGGGGGGGGGGDALPDLNVVTDTTYAQVTVDGVTKIQATLTFTNLKTNAVTTATRDVCTLGKLDVVTGSEYSTQTHKFTNTVKSVTVVGSPVAAQDAEVFTATAHTAEHGGS